MIEKAETLELLSAYVCGDVTPTERAAVELLLSGDAQSRTLVDELRNLSVTLVAGRKPLCAELLNALRRHVEAKTKELAEAECVEALVSASLSGDVNARERNLLEKHLNSKPQARAELNSLRELSVHLNRAELPAGDELSKKLAERLNAKLPAAARVGQPAKVSPPKTQSDRPSLRVYTSPDNPWRRVVLASAAIAALVALGLGLAHLFSEPAGPKISTGPNDPVKNPGDLVVNPNHEKQNVSPENRSQVPPNAPEIVEHKPQNQQKVPQPENQPIPVEKPQVVEKTPKNSLDPKAPKPNVPDEIVKQDPKTPPNVENNNPVIPGPANDPNSVAIPKNSNVPTLPPKQNDLQTIPGPSVVGTNQNTNPNNVAPTPNPNPNPVKPPLENVGATDALVAVVRDGNATVEFNGQRRTLKKGEVLTSGSSVITDVSRVALAMPGNAKLYINRGSRVVLNLDAGTEITLSSGEISYVSNGKTATINSENKTVSIRRASSVNVKVEANTMATYVTGEKAADVSTKGKSTSAKKNDKVVAALTGNEIPQRSGFTGQPDPWRNDMDDAQKTTTDDKDEKPADNKNRGGRARKK